ncbi:MAG TPA: hypothetical protein VG820_12730 [Fimbriimonadaceae bacterium]|nr:hypothetical protein [Fimbriimonadaceae bacterium]
MALAALVLAVLAAMFPFLREDQSPPSLKARIADIRIGSFITGAAVLVFAGCFGSWPSTFHYGNSIALALAIGALVGVFSAGADAGSGGFGFGMAVIGAALLHFLPSDGMSNAQVAFLTGCFVAAFATAGLRPKLTGGYLGLLCAVLVVAVDYLGRIAGKGADPASAAGTALGLASLIAALLAGVVSRFSKSTLVRGGIGFLALLLIGYLACWQYLGNALLGNLWIGGVVVGGAVHLLLAGEDQPEAFRFVLAAVIWLGAATVAFGMDLGYGMAVTLLGGAAALLLFGNMRGLMAIAVAAAILIYRLFRELFPDEAKALDIGQHYTMVGIAIGALLPLLPIEWARGLKLSRERTTIATVVWLLILLGLPIAAAVLLGSKGAIGMVVGLSFAAIVEGLRGTVSLAPAGIAVGLGSFTVLSFDWLGDWTDLERVVKLRAVMIVTVVALVLGSALFGLSRQKASEADPS